jgi:acyl dehydratase
MPNPPSRAPDSTVTEATQPNQAIIYRLCSDKNPLHIAPDMAAMGGFDRPILHGLCFFGFASRAVLKEFCANDVTQFKKVSVRFTSHVFPGDTLITEMWREGNTVVFTQKT